MSINQHLISTISTINPLLPLPTTLSGSSLLEVLSSLSLLGLLFVLSMSLVGQLQGKQSPVFTYQTQVLCREKLYESLDPEWVKSEESWLLKGREITRKLDPIDEQKGLFLLTVTCKWQEKEILKRQRIIQLNKL